MARCEPGQDGRVCRAGARPARHRCRADDDRCALAIRYRTKNKNLGQAAVESFAAAAERLGITPDELSDRVVPWLGFEPNAPRVIDCGGRRIEVGIGDDFKLKYRDLEKNKPVASLPKTAPKEVLDAFKGLAATLREVVKAQVLRLENLMVRQYRWPVGRWPELFLAHPLLRPFAARLVWAPMTTRASSWGRSACWTTAR